MGPRVSAARFRMVRNSTSSKKVLSASRSGVNAVSSSDVQVEVVDELVEAAVAHDVADVFA